MMVFGPAAAALVAATAAGRTRRALALGRRADAGRRRAALLLLQAALRLAGRTRWALLLLGALLVARAVFFARRSWRPLGAGRNRGERDAAAGLIDIDDPHFEHVANADDFVRIANEAVGQAADVHQAAVGQADIDEDAEIDDV